MSKVYISIQDSADLSKKSVQTIRRAIKAKKLKCKKYKTPQGFNYLISQESLFELYNITPPKNETKKTESKKKPAKKMKDISDTKIPEKMTIKADDFKTFTATLEKFLSQHSEERQNFLRLINTLQERIFVLENQLNLLKEPEKKNWFHFWK